ncbi:MAG: hypothetical protein IT385_17580 [Deltaproteobacteria bacterium]|nr:hypothetical protein [Deltaproteobacteria bacterium]
MDERHDDVSPEMQALLERRLGQGKRVAGPEPKDLEAIARWVDGDATSAEAERIRARVEADPELAEVVARLRDAEGERKVVPLQLGARPKKKILPAVIAATGVLAIAAAVLLIARPTDKGGSPELGAGLSGGGLGVQLEAGRAKAEGAQAGWLVTREGVAVLPLDEAGGGFVIPDERSWCSWVVVADWSADSQAEAAKLEGAVTGDKCVIESADALRARLPGVTNVGARKLGGR